MHTSSSRLPGHQCDLIDGEAYLSLARTIRLLTVGRLHVRSAAFDFGEVAHVHEILLDEHPVQGLDESLLRWNEILDEPVGRPRHDLGIGART